MWVILDTSGPTHQAQAVIRELLWSFFLCRLLPVELRGLVGASGWTGQGRVLLPWLLKPEVAVEEGEKPPLTRAERRHSTARITRQVRASTEDLTDAEEEAPATASRQQQRCHK